MTGNVGWQEWSTFGKQQFTLGAVDARSLTVDKCYDDTWHLAFGGQYRLSDYWLLSVGFAYDSFPVDAPCQNSPDLPFDEQYRYAVGAQYDWNTDVTISCSYEYVDLKHVAFAQAGPLSDELIGEYSTYDIHAFRVSMA